MAKKKRRRRLAQKLSPTEIDKRRQSRRFKADIRAMMILGGFAAFSSEGEHLEVGGQKSEFDGIFLQSNILLIVEHTEAKEPDSHFRKKLDFYEHCHKNRSRLFQAIRQRFGSLATALKNNGITDDEVQLRFIYCSRFAVGDGPRQLAGEHVTVLSYHQLQYFLATTKAIEKSGRFELFKFLDLELTDVGVGKAGQTSNSYQGLLLPEAPSGFPAGHRIVSFLADPKMLLEQAYVLRADGWRDTDRLYQRLLIKSKLKEMRGYLFNQQRVFVNNIIVTLPSDARIEGPNGSPLSGEAWRRPVPVQVSIARQFNNIGIIDGQHRVYCYHESADRFDAEIAKFRERQHLLVTGILCNPGLPTEDRQKFEAQLFLEINDKQRKVKGGLKQAIEVVVHPVSAVALAKAVIYGLASTSPLEHVLEVHFYDKRKVKTTSIVSYGLKYIVDIDATEHSFYPRWRGKDKLKIKSDPAVREAYIAFCVENLRNLFSAFKKNIPPDLWTTDRKVSRALSATAINGIVYCMRLLLTEDKLGKFDDYDKAMSNLKMEFTPKRFKYPPSHWKAVGEKVYNECFG